MCVVIYYITNAINIFPVPSSFSYHSHGNETTYNIHLMLANNILESSYYRSLGEIPDFNALVDELYNHVENVGTFQRLTVFSLL